MPVDRLEPEHVAALVRRIAAGDGRLDVLVDDIRGGELLVECNTPMGEHDLAGGLRMLRLAVETVALTPGWLRSELMLEHFYCWRHLGEVQHRGRPADPTGHR